MDLLEPTLNPPLRKTLQIKGPQMLPPSLLLPPLVVMVDKQTFVLSFLFLLGRVMVIAPLTLQRDKLLQENGACKEPVNTTYQEGGKTDST